MTREDKRAYNYARNRLANDDYPVYSDEYELKLAYKAGIEDAKNHPHWISVDEELPKENDFILIYGKDGVGVWLYESPNAEEKIIANHITHWMPLPAPPSCSEFPNNQERRVIGTADHIKTALDVMKEGGEE